jgi:hypothetical protein
MIPAAYAQARHPPNLLAIEHGNDGADLEGNGHRVIGTVHLDLFTIHQAA